MKCIYELIWKESEREKEREREREKGLYTSCGPCSPATSINGKSLVSGDDLGLGGIRVSN